MENQLQRVNNTPAFIQDATSSLEKMKAYAQLLADSELLPKHFYKLDQYKKPVKDSSGKMTANIPAIIMTIQHGLEVGMSISQALQQIVPINGVTAIKGDGAMALIQNKNACIFWKEEISGSIETEDYTVKLHAKHQNGREKHIEFSVNDAKRLGLWVTPDMVAKNDNLRHGGWWKTPKRMIAYRALGYMARDLFPEILQGMYTDEEARDFNEDNTVMQTSDGLTVKIAGNTKGEAMNQAALGALQAAKPTTPKARKSKPAEAVQQQTIDVEATDVTSVSEKEYAITDTVVYTQEQLVAMSNAGLLSLTSKVMGFDVDVELFPTEEKKKNRTKANLVNLILAKQDDTSEDMLKNVFGYDLIGDNSLGDKNDSTQEKGSPESHKTTYPDAPEEGRPFETCLEMSDSLAAGGVEEDDIMAFIQSNGLPYVDTESFFKFATGAMIDKLTEEHSN